MYTYIHKYKTSLFVIFIIHKNFLFNSKNKISKVSTRMNLLSGSSILLLLLKKLYRYNRYTHKKNITHHCKTSKLRSESTIGYKNIGNRNTYLPNYIK